MFKRPLIPVAILFVAGVLLSAYKVSIVIKVAFCLAAGIFTYFKTKKLFLSFVTILLITAGLFRMDIAQNYQSRIIAEYSGISTRMKLTVCDFSENNRVTASFNDGNRTHKVLIISDENTELFPGDIMEGDITLNSPFTNKIKRAGARESYAGNNIFLMGFTENLTPTGEKQGGIKGVIYSLRNYMDRLGEKHFSGNDRAFYNAMVFGDKRYISDELYSALQSSGLNHIAVVSGMHLSVAIACMTLLVQKLFGKRRRGYFLVLAATFFLALITGAGASVIRAFIMSSFYLAAQILYRENDSPSSLAVAVVIMVIANPFIIFNVGFVLSVLSVAGIFVFERKIYSSLIRFAPDKFAKVISISVSAQLMVIPVIVYYFGGTLAPYSILSNALLVPLSGIYVILGMAFVCVSLIPFASQLIALGMNIISYLISTVCFGIEDFKFSLVEISGALSVFIVLWMFLAFLIRIRPFNKRKRLVTSAVFMVIALVLCFVPESPEINFNTVAYGGKMMTAVETDNNNAFLVDCPDIYDMYSIENPDNPFSVAVLSSGNAGQIFAAESNVKTLIVPEAVCTGYKKEKLLNQARKTGITVMFKRDSEKFQVGDAVMEYIGTRFSLYGRILKIYHNGKTFITFQGMSGSEIAELEKSGTCFESDYVILPFSAFDCGKSFFAGKVLNSDFK